eukprot:NODE_135_length_16508_cov_1.365897.p1 type:complete len:868 gc:universal NODE_135_length_16508_cov_1.365897:12848-15451(+)
MSKLEQLFDRNANVDSELELESSDQLNTLQIPKPLNAFQNTYNSNQSFQSRHASVQSDTSNLILFDQGNDKDNMANYLSTRSIDTFVSSTPQVNQDVPKTQLKWILNTWSGVFIPSIHACIGITIFLRLPWIIGWSGVTMSLIYLLIGQTLIGLTCTSVAAIASNGFKSGGGPYYMISRSLGKEIGVSVGLILWLSLCVSSTIYISGSALILSRFLFPAMSFKDLSWNTHVYGSVLLLLLTPSQFLNKKHLYFLNMTLFAFVILSVLSLMIGLLSNEPRYDGIQKLPGNLSQNMEPSFLDFESDLLVAGGPFMYFFAVFFPSISGIIPGLNRSGSLRHPAESLKIGLFSNLLITTILYTIIILLLGCVVNQDLLQRQYSNNSDRLVIAMVSWPTDVVQLVLIFFSAIGAAIYCFSGANSLLGSVANDGIIPILKNLNATKKSSLIWRTILVTMIVTLIFLQIGSFDILSKATSLINLLTFCFLNWSTALLGFLKTPGWRPSFKFYHWSSSLLGGILSLGLMFAFDWRIAVGAVLFMGVLIGYVQYYGALVDWGDAITALNLQISQRNLVKLEKYSDTNVKNWRPQLLGFAPINHEHDSLPAILSFLSQIKKGRGLTIILSVIITEDLNKVYSEKQNEKLQQLLKSKMVDHGINGFAEVLVSRSLVDGIAHAVQLSGLGKLSPNTVVMGYMSTRDNMEKCEQYVEAIKAVLICKKGLVLLKSVSEFPTAHQLQTGYIDVYWIRHDGGMLSILPHLLKKHHIWRKCKLRIFALAELTDNSVEIERNLKEALLELRIEAYSEVIELGDSDISEFTYERTMQLQERQEYLKKIRHDMGRNRKNSLHLFIRDEASSLAISPYIKQQNKKLYL